MASFFATPLNLETFDKKLFPMPIGVPKVPFRMPGEPSAQWVDLYNRLYRERVLFLCQELDDELKSIDWHLLYLNAEEESKGLFLYINSPGGSVTCGIAVYDNALCRRRQSNNLCRNGRFDGFFRFVRW